MCLALAPEEEVRGVWLALQVYMVSRVHKFTDCPWEMMVLHRTGSDKEISFNTVPRMRK